MSTSDLIALSAALIACSAFFLAVYSAYETRKYNRLSMTPLLDDDVLFTESSEKIGLIIENKGIGPAAVVSWELFVDGIPYQKLEITRFEDLTTFLGLKESVTYGFFKPGALILQGRSHPLFCLTPDPYSVERNDSIREALKRLRIKITYRSLYEEKKVSVYEFIGEERF